MPGTAPVPKDRTLVDREERCPPDCLARTAGADMDWVQSAVYVWTERTGLSKQVCWAIVLYRV